MFILDRPNSPEITYIFCKLTLIDGPFKQTTGLKIKPTHWDSVNKRVDIGYAVGKIQVDEYRSINAFLSRLSNFIDERERSARFGADHLTCLELEYKLREMRGKSTDRSGFFLAGNDIIEDMKSGKLTTEQGKRYSKGTIKNYVQSLEIIKEFNPHTTFSMIKLDYYRSFQQWCNEKNFSLNYFGQHVKNLKRLMREAHARKLHKNTFFEDKMFKTLQEETIDFCPAVQDIVKLYLVQGLERLEGIARDWFIIDCCTGLRVIDIQILDIHRHFSENLIQIVNEKTDIKVAIPVHTFVKNIIAKWKGLPPKISDQQLNDHIKSAAKKAGLTKMVIYSLTKGGVRKDYYLPEHDMYSNHTARAFFITYLLRLGTPDNKVMQLAGIKKHSTLLRYKKTLPEDNARDEANNAFFSGMQVN
jgi:site-specific recombinase XerD